MGRFSLSGSLSAPVDASVDSLSPLSWILNGRSRPTFGSYGTPWTTFQNKVCVSVLREADAAIPLAPFFSILNCRFRTALPFPALPEPTFPPSFGFFVPGTPPPLGVTIVSCRSRVENLGDKHSISEPDSRALRPFLRCFKPFSRPPPPSASICNQKGSALGPGFLAAFFLCMPFPPIGLAASYYLPFHFFHPQIVHAKDF